MQQMATREIEEKIQAEVTIIVAAAIIMFNRRNNSKGRELTAPGRFFGAFTDILRDNWSKFDPEGIPEALKDELANMIAAEMEPSRYSSCNLYVGNPGYLITHLRRVIEQDKPDIQAQPHIAMPAMKP